MTRAGVSCGDWRNCCFKTPENQLDAVTWPASRWSDVMQRKQVVRRLEEERSRRPRRWFNLIKNCVLSQPNTSLCSLHCRSPSSPVPVFNSENHTLCYIERLRYLLNTQLMRRTYTQNPCTYSIKSVAYEYEKTTLTTHAYYLLFLVCLSNIWWIQRNACFPISEYSVGLSSDQIAEICWAVTRDNIANQHLQSPCIFHLTDLFASRRNHCPNFHSVK